MNPIALKIEDSVIHMVLIYCICAKIKIILLLKQNFPLSLCYYYQYILKMFSFQSYHEANGGKYIHHSYDINNNKNQINAYPEIIWKSNIPGFRKFGFSTGMSQCISSKSITLWFYILLNKITTKRTKNIPIFVGGI